jgi:hypothetical protein
MGNRILVNRDNVTPTGGNDLFTYVSASARRARLRQFTAVGAGTTSAAQRFTVARADTAGITPGGAITPTKFDHSEQAAAVGVIDTTWGTQPVINANNGEQVGFNALGGSNRWVPPGGAGLEVRNAENLSFRANSGPTWQAVSASAVIEED